MDIIKQTFTLDNGNTVDVYKVIGQYNGLDFAFKIKASDNDKVLLEAMLKDK